MARFGEIAGMASAIVQGIVSQNIIVVVVIRGAVIPTSGDGTSDLVEDERVFRRAAIPR